MFTPIVQEKVIEFSVLPDTVSFKSRGASAYVIIFAPFPAVEVPELPYLLIATT